MLSVTHYAYGCYAMHRYPLRVPLLAMHSELWQWQTNADKEHQLVANIAKGDVTQVGCLVICHHTRLKSFTAKSVQTSR